MAESYCGGCSMCCKLLGVEEIAKPPRQWCKHCVVGQGCSIYAERPTSCITYECVWLTLRLNKAENDSSLDDLRPDRCRVIGDADKDGMTHHVRVDPSRPNAWKEKKVLQFIGAIAAHAEVYLVQGETRTRLRIQKDKK